MNRAALLDVSRRLETAERVLRSLVGIRTENPPGDTSAAVAFVEGLCREVGWQTLLVGDAPALSLLTWIGETGPAFVLNAHLDTVGAGEAAVWTSPPFEGRVVDGRLYGRGAADNKGGVVAALLALLDLTTDPPGGMRAGAMFVADEETGGEGGTGRIVRDGHLARLDVRAAIVCDGSGQERGRWGVRVATKGALRLDITTHGLAVHSSRPSQGRNAVLAASDALLRLSALAWGDHAHPLLGAPGLTPGTLISGGTTPNTIPAECTATVDCRLVPGMNPQEVADRVEALVTEAAAAWGCTATVAVRQFVPPVEVDPDHPLIRIVCEAIRDVTGQEPVIRGLPGGNDARFLVAAGIPTVVGLSPSDAATSRSHGADENVALADVVTAGRIYAAAIRAWAAAGGRSSV